MVQNQRQAMEFPILMAQEVCKVYMMGDAEVHALRNASILVRPREFLAIMGTSGSGKSTLLQILGCLDRPSTGKVFLEGQDVAFLPDIELARVRNRKLGFIFQAFNLMPQETAANNVEVPLQYAGLGKKERRRLAIEALTSVGLADRVDHRPAELSGGQRQRVAIARAIVNKPVVILADEPTGALDSKSGVEVMGILQQLNEQGRTIVMVTHDLSIAQYAQRVIKLSDGAVVSDEPVGDRKRARPRAPESRVSRVRRQTPDMSVDMVPTPARELVGGPTPDDPAETAGQRVCPRCSSANRNGSSYCRECGFSLNQTNLGRSNVRARLAGSQIECDSCGAKNRPIVKFCVVCGSLMDRSYSGV